MTRLSDKQEVLLGALRTNGGWMRRADLARSLGKDVLSPEDVMALDLLGDEGFLVKEVSDQKPEGDSVRYRFSEPKANIKST
jgi:hypothetical protein